MHILNGIRQAIREERYRISSHANEEMSDDEFEAGDIESIIHTGKIAQKFTGDPRGNRYEIVGNAMDGRCGYVVCRFLPSGILLIITAYAEEE